MFNFTIYNSNTNQNSKNLLVINPVFPDNLIDIVNYLVIHIKKDKTNIMFIDLDNNLISLISLRILQRLYTYIGGLPYINNIYINNNIITSQSNYKLYTNILEAMRINDTPSNIATANNITNHILKYLPKNVDIKVLDYDMLLNLGFGGILGINQGSSNKPNLVILEYGDKTKSPIVLVGKGVTFDGGGMNIKHGNMSDMKIDKCGAIYVYSLIKSLAENNINEHFIGFLPFVENVLGNGSIKSGDVISLYDKTTVEVVDTDAEGRIIMADCLGFIKENLKPKLIIDIATLTGQAATFYGNIGTATMYNTHAEKYVDKLVNLGDNNLEFFWKLRLHQIYDKFLKSKVADIRNFTYSNTARVIFSGQFLQYFIKNNTPWIHLDIAGVAFGENSTGEPLLTLYQYLSTLEKN